MANTPPLKLTRNQLAAFLKDHESIKAFENLFNLTEAIAPDIVQEVTVLAESARSSANQAEGIALQAINDAAILAESARSSANQAEGIALQAINDAMLSAASAEARANIAMQTASEARTMAELAATNPAPVPPKRTRFAQFFDTTTQTAALPNTAYAITYNTTDLSYGVRLRSPSTSEIEVDTDGVYNFQFSIQLDKTSGGAANFWIWARKNGADVANTASQIQIQGNNHEIFSSANLMFDLKAGDYIQFMWAVGDVSVQLTSFAAAAPVPAIPSIIVTVTNNIRT